MRKYIIPGSVRIKGLPGIDENVGVRDTGSGQLWSGDKRVGSINYWTGLLLLDKVHFPKVRFWDAMLILLGLKAAALPNISSEYEVTDLDDGAGYYDLNSAEQDGVGVYLGRDR
jgi:hypothetical protein